MDSYTRRDLIMGGMAFPPAMYPEVKGFFDKVKGADDEEVVVKAGTHAATN